MAEPLAISLYEGIMTTRAIRRFTTAPVDDEVIGAILAAAQQAPSGGNLQPWQFVVVTDADLRRQIGELYRAAYQRYEAALLPMVPPIPDDDARTSWERTIAASRHLAEHLAEVPVLIFVAMPELSLTLVDDEGPIDIGPLTASVFPAVQNLMLAARSFGLGSVLTTVFRARHDEIRELLGVPAHHQLMALVPVGHPAGRFGVAPRRPVAQVTHWNRWGDRGT
jgi:nitroreductase